MLQSSGFSNNASFLDISEEVFNKRKKNGKQIHGEGEKGEPCISLSIFYFPSRTRIYRKGNVRLVFQAKAVDLQSPPSQSISNSSGTNASHPLVTNPSRYEPSRNLIRRAISSLPVGNSSTAVHQHRDTLKSTISSRTKEKEIHTSSSLSNTNKHPPVQPNIVFGSFPAQPNQAKQQFMVAETSSTTSSPPHPGHGILGRTPPHPDHGILGCKPIGYIYQHVSAGVVNNLSAMYTVPYYYYSGYQHASPEEINLQLSYNVPNSYMRRTVINQSKAKPSTSTSVEFLPGRVHTVQSQRERGDFQRQNLAPATQQQQGWPNLYTLFPPLPPPSSSSPPPPQVFGGKGKFGEDPNDPYYPLPAHFINMDEFS
uniref:formin-like protein 7 n=1 Tax=Fragaria vesca subsp. vesca TaxID=101020 RepID=UPI0005CAD917|nr:PREDICTED: formin-like protein 7 [Fragaria vesca subsp. vesca]